MSGMIRTDSYFRDLAEKILRLKDRRDSERDHHKKPTKQDKDKKKESIDTCITDKEE